MLYYVSPRLIFRFTSNQKPKTLQPHPQQLNTGPEWFQRASSLLNLMCSQEWKHISICSVLFGGFSLEKLVFLFPLFWLHIPSGSRKYDQAKQMNKITLRSFLLGFCDGLILFGDRHFPGDSLNFSNFTIFLPCEDCLIQGFFAKVNQFLTLSGTGFSVRLCWLFSLWIFKITFWPRKVFKIWIYSAFLKITH